MNDARPDPQRYWGTGTGPVRPDSGRPPLTGHGIGGLAPGRGMPPFQGAMAPNTYGTPPHPPTGPPARVGSAVAALAAAVLTLIFPALFLLLGQPLLALLVNIPGITLGAVTLTKTSDPPEVDRFIGYTWACTIAYMCVMVCIIASIIMLLLPG